MSLNPGKRQMRLLVILFLFFVSGAWSGLAMAHALLERSDPAPGAVLGNAPAAVTVFFDAELEPAFCKLIVKNQQGVKVSQDNGDTASAGPKSLTVKLSTRAKGVYRVYWDVVSRDGHRASGDFTFTVQ